MSRLVFISNRVAAPKEGEAFPSGGLATAIRSAIRHHDALWIGWSGRIAESERGPVSIQDVAGASIATFDLTRDEYEEYYNGYANRTLWPLFHYRVDLAQYERAYSRRYYDVNDLFAQMAQPLLRPDDLIWIHDYHLIPCAEALRQRGVKNRIGFFLHTPWPARELLVTLPRHQNLVRALFAYDLLGFQTEIDRQAFHDYVVNEAGGHVLADGTAICFGRSVATGAFPIGIDVDLFADLPNGGPARRHQRRIEQSTGGRQLIFGVDRLDYSKGIPDRFAAYERLLEAHPDHRNNVVLLQIATSSRSEVDEYQNMRLELEAMAGRINGRYAEYDWVPLRYVNRSYSQAALAGLYRAADIAFITPLRDGMNLVAKEFVAAQDPADPGVLILSRFAGAGRELREALIVNPYDRAEMADALQRALAMPLDQRRMRWRSMMDSLVRNDVVAWREGFVAALQSVPVTHDNEPVGDIVPPAGRAAG